MTIDHGNADFLSCLPKASKNLDVKDDITMYQIFQIEALPLTSSDLSREAVRDEELGPLLAALRRGQDLQRREME